MCFFFKQKTAYEMRISDWSSDVCSSYVYELGFRMELLMKGINPDAVDFDVNFAERRTDSPNQRADLALKYQALGVPPNMVYETAGLNPAQVREQQDEDAGNNDPSPNPTQPRGMQTGSASGRE